MIRTMRRLIALLVMLIIPLQFAWSAASGLHGHLGENVAALGVHAHDHDYHNAGHDDHDLSMTGDTDNGHDKEHHSNHCHHVLSFILTDSSLALGSDLSGVSNPHPPDVSLTHTPALPQRPPLARA